MAAALRTQKVGEWSQFCIGGVWYAVFPGGRRSEHVPDVHKTFASLLSGDRQALVLVSVSVSVLPECQDRQGRVQGTVVNYHQAAGKLHHAHSQ